MPNGVSKQTENVSEAIWKVRKGTFEPCLPYARDGRPLFSYNRSRFITAFMEVKKIYFTILTAL